MDPGEDGEDDDDEGGTEGGDEEGGSSDPRILRARLDSRTDSSNDVEE